MEVPQRNLFIDGAWVAPLRGEHLPVINPATELPFTRIPNATAEDVDAAVSAAVSAAKRGVWTKSTGAHRARFLRAIAAKVRGDPSRPLPAAASAPGLRRPRISDVQVRERKPLLAKIETADCGKPIDEAEWDMVGPAAPLPLARKMGGMAWSQRL